MHALKSGTHNFDYETSSLVIYILVNVSSVYVLYLAVMKPYAVN